MLESAIVEGIAAGGPIAVLAYLIFRMYRTDRTNTESRIHDVHEAHSERLESLLSRDLITREKNTAALTELTTLIKRINGNS